MFTGNSTGGRAKPGKGVGVVESVRSVGACPLRFDAPHAPRSKRDGCGTARGTGKTSIPSNVYAAWDGGTAKMGSGGWLPNPGGPPRCIARSN
jgi:hypothetical protein